VKPRRRILLYGNSVILGSVGASLQRSSQFEVTKLAPPLEEALKRNTEKPDILLFDLETTPAEAVFSFLESDPGLLLIGISPDINLVKVWSIKELREVSMGDLLEVITSGAKETPVEPGGDEVRPH
jgi:hypothetical protein